MVNNRKVRLMTQLAIYEKKEGREDIRLSKYFKSDYARLNVLRTAVMVTIAYILVVMLCVFYKLEFILDNALTLDYKGIGKMILGVYIGVMAVYLIGAFLGYSIKYTLSHRKLGRYFRMLRKLRTMYIEEDEAAEEESDEGEEGYDD